jgi:rhodanese-related sulfurtransferase
MLWVVTHSAWGQIPPELGPEPSRCLDTTVESPREALKSLATAHTPSPSTKERTAHAAAAACWLEPEEVNAFIASQPTVYWVDIRPSRQANALPLAGSLRIAPDDISHKPFLREATLLLIGTGWDDTVVSETCARLHEVGIAVRALRGGLMGWQAAGRPIVLVPEGHGPDEMEATDFIEAAPRESWPVIALDVPAQADLGVPVARLARISAKKTWSPARMFPRAARQKQPIIVLASDQTQVDQLRAQQAIQQRRTPGRMDNVIWVRGGFAAYRTALVQQQALATRWSLPIGPPCRNR